MHVKMEGITKRFGPVLANDRIDFQVREGEVHAILTDIRGILPVCSPFVE